MALTATKVNRTDPTTMNTSTAPQRLAMPSKPRSIGRNENAGCQITSRGRCSCFVEPDGPGTTTAVAHRTPEPVRFNSPPASGFDRRGIRPKLIRQLSSGNSTSRDPSRCNRRCRGGKAQWHGRCPRGARQQQLRHVRPLRSPLQPGSRIPTRSPRFVPARTALAGCDGGPGRRRSSRPAGFATPAQSDRAYRSLNPLSEHAAHSGCPPTVAVGDYHCVRNR